MMEIAQELALIDGRRDLMPALAIDDARQRYHQMREFVQNEMIAGIDYGSVGGTGKPTLLKPGAEKLKTLFGLSDQFVLVERIQDWTGDAYVGEPLFYYWYKCKLYRGDTFIGEAEGSCNSWEVKYRYRKAERLCPRCGQAAIIKGKTDYGGGWVCWKGSRPAAGCGAKFAEDDSAITQQQVGRVRNTDPADIVNTILKMAQKRAFVAAVLICANASEFFNQDLEDFEEIEKPQSATERIVVQKTGEIVEDDDTAENSYRKGLWKRWWKGIEIANAEGIEFQSPSTDATNDALQAATDALAKLVKETRQAKALAKQLV